MSYKAIRAVMIAATSLYALPALADEKAPSPAAPAAAVPTLEKQFQDPPQSARPRVWWHWMNGNVTKDGIAKDMAWMKRVGIGGLQNFDANLETPQVVDHRLVYMTPEWKDAFRFAATEADRLGLELAIASSPGWSETGGPWVPPQDGLKKLVWSETRVAGGRRITAALAAPPSITGPFQSIKGDPENGLSLSGGNLPPLPAPFYADVAVLAVPMAPPEALAQPRYHDGLGKELDGSHLTDADLNSSIEIARPKNGSPMLLITYVKPQEIRSATLYMPGIANLISGGDIVPRLEVSDDGETWRKVADLPLSLVPTTVAFAPVTARNFRILMVSTKGAAFNLQSLPAGVDFAAMGSMAASFMTPKPILIGDLHLFSLDRIDRAETKAGYTVQADYFQLQTTAPETVGVAPDRVIDLTGKMRPDGSLDWMAPPGRWRILRLGYSLTGIMNHPATKEATGLEVDKFDGAAVKRYLDHYLAMYKNAAGAELVGKRGVRAMLTDSIEVGASNWTPRFVERFRKMRGYDPTPWLPSLTGIIIGSRTESDKFLYDYRRTLAELVSSEHYGTIAAVAHDNDLKVYGEALEDQRPSLGDDMAMRSHADVPMAALWTYPRSQGPNPGHLADMKGAASVAHIYGQNIAAAESMTSLMSPWAFGPSDLKRIIDLEFVTGINLPVVHTSVHVPRDDKVPGLSLSIFGQYFNRNEAWAELARPWVDYMSRNSLMLQQGRNVADVGYFYGEEAPLSGLYKAQPVADAPKAYAYDFINADALLSVLRCDGVELETPSGARYRALYLGGSSSKMTLAALRKIFELVESGATIVGPKPESSPSLAGDSAEWSALAQKLWADGDVTRVGKGRVIASTDIDAALARIGIPPDFDFSGNTTPEDLPFIHRELADGDSYFLSNRRDAAVSVEARFRVTGKAPELWHAESGTSEPVSYEIRDGITVVPLQLGADESVHVMFRKPAAAQSLTVASPAPVQLSEIGGPWTIAFQPGRGAPASATMASLAPLNENANPAIKYFSGEATYAHDFEAPRGWKRGQRLWLDLGEAREVAEVTVNGKEVGYAWHAPYRVDIGAVTKPGRNSLSIRVANLWVNRMIGDAQPGATKVTWFTGPGYRKDAPLRKSGLVGPVRLLGEGR